MPGTLAATTVLDESIPGDDPPPSIAEVKREARVFATRVESMLSVVERDGAKDGYQAQVARALLSALLEAIGELDTHTSGSR